MKDALPPPPINAQINGLLSFLGIKNGGRNPQHLTEELVPTLDLLPWYLANTSENLLSSSTVINAVGFTALTGLTVPAGEWWFVQHYTVVSGVLGAGESLRFQPAWTDTQGLLVCLGQYQSVTSSVGSAVAGTNLVGSFWVPPGGVLGVHTNLLGATPSLSGSLRFARLRV